MVSQGRREATTLERRLPVAALLEVVPGGTTVFISSDDAMISE